MDEQPRRRRRQRSEDMQQSAPREESMRIPGEEREAERHPHRDDAASGNEQTHHRRRRAIDADAVHAQQNDRAADVQADSEEVFWHPAPEKKQTEQTAKKHTAQFKPLQAVSAVDGVVCRIGDFCLAALKWTGIALLFGVGFVVNGIGRLISAKPARRSGGTKESRQRTSKRTGDKKASSSKPRMEETEITLEPTRPEDYRGMGSKRAAEGKHHRSAGKKSNYSANAQQRKASLAYSTVMAVCLCVALFSAYMIGSIVWRSVSTKRLSNTLSERYSELSGSQEEENSTSNDADAFIASPDAAVSSVVVYTGNAAVEEMQSDLAVIAQATAAPTQKDVVRSTRFHQVGGDALPEMEALYQDNRDLIGWLRMEGILDLPVVYRDNEYYLTRDFYKNKSASGTLFLDENHPFKENAQNLLLHGHNMKDGTMFGRLVQYETNLQFLKNNPFIQYSTLWRKEQYVIFAVLHVSLDTRSEEFFNYFTHHTFSSDAQFESYVRALQNRSVFSIPVDVNPSDALLTLSTCLNDDRLVIVARRLREGESKSELRHLVQLADRQ